MNLDQRPPLNVTSLRSALGPPWRHLEVVAETGSTNADLIARAAAGEDIDGVVLIAENQTAGHGRMGRTWSTAPRAQITLSVGVGARDVPTAGWGWLPLAAGLAVVDAVAVVTGIEAGLKWPNDVLVGDRKLAGILAEVASSETVIVVGVGLNVTLHPDEAGGPNATSLRRPRCRGARQGCTGCPAVARARPSRRRMVGRRLGRPATRSLPTTAGAA